MIRVQSQCDREAAKDRNPRVATEAQRREKKEDREARMESSRYRLSSILSPFLSVASVPLWLNLSLSSRIFAPSRLRGRILSGGAA